MDAVLLLHLPYIRMQLFVDCWLIAGEDRPQEMAAVA